MVEVRKVLATTSASVKTLPVFSGHRSDPFIFLIYEDTDEKNVVGGQLVTEDNLFDCHRESGQAECECPESRTGSRCEVDPCSNFCLPHSTACRCLLCKFDMLTT